MTLHTACNTKLQCKHFAQPIYQTVSTSKAAGYSQVIMSNTPQSGVEVDGPTDIRI
jgi:hypothetical protein